MNESETIKERVTSEASRVKTSGSDVGVMSGEGTAPHHEKDNSAAHLHDQILPTDHNAKAGQTNQQGRGGQPASEDRTGQTATIDNGVRPPGSPDSAKVPTGIGSVENEALVAMNIRPRYSKFLETTGKKVLVRNCSMEEVVQKIQEGCTLWKVRGINKWFQRHYKVDIDNMCLVGESKKWWSPGGGVGSEGAENAVPLVEITEIREGWKTDTFNKVSSHTEKLKEKGGGAGDEPVLEENKCFSIIHGQGGRDVLDLVASTEEERDAWVTGLSHLVQSVKALHEEKQYDVWLRKQFEEADKDNNGSLNFSECCALLKQLNIKMDKIHAKKLFNQANTSKQKRDGEQVLEVEEFVAFYHALLKMPEVEKLYKKYCSEKTGLMSADQLCAFLHKEQGLTDYDHSQATKLMNEFEISNLKDQGYMTQDGFYHLLLSDMIDVFNCNHQNEIHQDMTQPLSHYFIDSSHNTYLTGHQLAGESSVEGYISALKRGCRLLELDLWDGDDGEPIIYHGHTLTSKITLADVLRDGIKLYAFEASPYPVILSIENHLSLDQQRTMVKLMKDILGDMLATDPVPDDITVIPSPEALKNKIIIRAKKPKGSEVEDDDEDDDDQDSIDYIDSDDGAAQSKKDFFTPHLLTLYRSFKSSKKRKQSSTKKRRMSQPQTEPSTSSPIALNMQTEDKANFYNDALFKSNANCGYVLKPDILLKKEPYSPSELSDRYTKVIRVTVLSGQHLPNSAKKGDIVDPYVQVKVRGHPLDKQKQRTKVVKNNGFNPVWNETLELRIKVPHVSLIYFSLRDESSLARDPVLALCCIPFNSLTTGYRFVHLTDLGSKSLAPSALFVHISISDN
ncbi:1-phosphatidylinositol 4,5-bisphosphate phosphodiesterase eta-2-like [Penaeus indicus]|uniref:1-phosphatidylinositol 4,5-bisphosphate phosphodiesterase eta-2-like n=1 Tax=Penaeus indicus TaxID=29960 RepID=UPI00300CC239